MDLDQWSIIPDDLNGLCQTECPGNITLSLLQTGHIIYTVIIPIMCSTGIAFNCLNLAVFGQSVLSGTYFTFLVALSAVDLCTLIIVLPIGFSRCYCPNTGMATYAAKIYESYVYLPLGNTSATISIWVTTALTIERFLSVKKLMIASKNNTVCRARMTVVTQAIFSLILNFPYFFYKEVTPDNRIVHAAFVTSIGFQIFSWIRFALAKIVPCFVVFIANMFLIHEVWLAHRRRKAMVMQNLADAKRMQVQIRLTLMLICVSIGFMVGHLPDSFSHIGVVTSIFGKCSMCSVEYHYFRLISNSLETASYSYHFFIYVIFNQQYKDVLRKTLLCYSCRGIKSNKVWPQAIATERGNIS